VLSSLLPALFYRFWFLIPCFWPGLYFPALGWSSSTRPIFCQEIRAISHDSRLGSWLASVSLFVLPLTTLTDFSRDWREIYEPSLGDYTKGGLLKQTNVIDLSFGNYTTFITSFSSEV